jgi:WD40 repeat protein
MSTRRSATLVALVLLLAACGTHGDRGGADDQVLVVRDGSGSWEDRILTLNAADGAVQQELSIGTPSSDWSVVHSATTEDERTTVRSLSIRTGEELASTQLDGIYLLPPVGPGGLPGGLSHDGRRLVLQGEPEPRASRFAVLDAASLDLIADIVLPGSFTYDVLSPDGSVLYLLEYLESDHSGSYQVRALDLDLGRLRQELVVDKVTLRSAMEGHPVAQLLDTDGRISYTVYHNDHHGPFIHALNTTDGTAICIDLPKEGRDDHAAGRYWGLALSPDGRTLFAANAALGLAAAIDTVEEKVVDTSAFAAPGPGRMVAAAERDLAAAPMLGVVSLSSDGEALYAVGPDGLAVIDTASLELLERHMPGTKLSSVAVSHDGDRLYVAGGGSITVLDRTSGERVGDLAEADHPYGLVAVPPGS